MQPTPEDLPLAKVTADELEEILGTWPSLEDLFPLAPLQEGLFFQSHLDESGSAYFVQAIFELEGEVRSSLLREAWQQLLDRHDALRAVPILDYGRPLQAVCSPVTLPWAELDLTRLDAPSRPEELERWKTSDRLRGFDLSTSPLLRITLIRTGPTRCSMALSIHHGLMDGWSAAVLLHELFQSYGALHRKQPPPLAPAIPYRDYIVWLEARDGQVAREFWKRYLSDVSEVAALPAASIAGETPGASTSEETRTSVFELSPEATARLEGFARRHRSTLNLVCQTAWALLQARYSDRSSALYGITVSGRTPELDGFETMVGLFINTLPVVLEELDTRSALEVIRNLSRDQGAREPYQYVPLQEIQTLSPLAGGTALFDLLWVFENYPIDPDGTASANLPFQIADAAIQDPTHYPLTVSGHRSDVLGFRISWQTTRYEATAIERLGRSLTRLLLSLLDAPETPGGQLSLLSPAERAQLLVAFNDSADDSADDSASLAASLSGNLAAAPVSMIAAFHRRLEEIPDEPALLWATEEKTHRLTYRQLGRRVERLAAYLVERGFGPEDRLGVLLKREPDLIVSLLGILSAGAAYVPLDPAYPVRRLSFILKDAAVPLLLTHRDALAASGLEEGVLEEGGIEDCPEIVFLEDLPTDSSPKPVSRTAVLHPDQLAYLIYTSGSTGTPKAVAVSHGAARSLLIWARSVYSREDLRGVLTATSVCFDLSVFEIFLTLSEGGTLILVDNVLSTRDLGAWDPEVAAAVTLINTVPSAITELLRSGGLPPKVRVVNLAGEPLSSQLADDLYALGSVEKVFDLYGPSEDTTYSTYTLRRPGGPATIGGPIHNTRVYVADRHLEPLPLGAPGEVLIGGTGLARGYLGRRRATAQRFVPDPFSPTPGQRLYRTGDRALFHPTGELRLLGRIDHQVKIRGFRIELGEIEAALRRQDGIREAALVVDAARAGKRLVAFLCGDSEEELAAAPLRAALAQTLPEYMLPAAFVFLDELPTLANGKLDRRALSTRAAAAGLGTTAAGTAPGTTEEELLAGIWADVLELPGDSVGSDSNFFALGGHSLTATRLTALVRKTFGVELPLKEIFSRPVLTDLAAYLMTLAGASEELIAPPGPGRRDGVIPLSFAQQRLWFLYRLEGPSATYNLPGALRLQGGLEIPALRGALDELRNRHEILRTRFAGSGPPTAPSEGPFQIISEPRPEPLRVVDLSALGLPRGELEVERLFQKEAARPFELESEDLFRVCLLRLGSDDHVLLLNLHHIITDGWSMGVLGRELSLCYRSLLSSGPDLSFEPPALEDLPLQYADYAIWQRDWLRAGVAQAQTEYWRRTLGDAPQALDLPTSRPRPAQQTFRGGSEPFHLEVAATARLHRLARRTHSTLFLVLEAAFAELLGRYSHATDLNIGTPVANRRFAELEPLVGLFVNTLVLRNRRGGEETVIRRLATVRDMALGAFAHQDLPFEQLVEALNPVRDASRSPLFQVLFVLQNTPGVDLELPGLITRRLSLGDSVAKFDLTLSLEDSSEGLRGALEYNRDLFDRTTIRRMVDQLGRLLEGFGGDPGARVRDLGLLSTAQRFQLLHGFAPAHVAAPRGLVETWASIPALFRAKAREHPEAPALVWGSQRVSYGQLSGSVEALAEQLIQLGAGPERRVAVLLHRKPELIVSLLAVLATGAAYVPLDPAYPRDRLAFMLEDAEAALLVTRGDALEASSLIPQCPVLHLDEKPSGASAGTRNEGRRRPAIAIHPLQLAYLIYTSGSTGTPKAVAVSHGAAAGLLDWARSVYCAKDLEGVLAATSVCFDLSVFEIFLTLTQGGTLILVDDVLAAAELVRRNPEAAKAISLINSVPSALAELLRTGQVPPARVINLAGEPLTRELADELYQLPSVEKVYDLYGPSEDTTYSTYALRTPGGAASIGRPIQDSRAYLLDRYLLPTPLGVPGELVLAGAGLARGYLARPGQTAQRFVPDPFGGRPGERLYRTGDLAVYGCRGDLELRGRIDHQIKIRGFRIEIGEIEATLRRETRVREAAVVVDESREDRRLVAFLEAADWEEISAGELRTYLAKSLPEHMIPAAFIVQDALPAMANGKLDRRALTASAAQLGDPAAAAAEQPPASPEEAVLREVWAEILGLQTDVIGRGSNFFTLGGHSLAAMRLAARVRATLGVELPLRDIFQHPTVGGLLDHLATLRSDTPQLPPPQAQQRSGILPPSFAQQRLWFLDRQTGPSGTYNMPVAVRMEGPLVIPYLESALGSLEHRHEALRTRLPAEEGSEGPSQVIDPPRDFSLAMIDLSGLGEACRRQQAQEWVDRDAELPFDLAAGPLFRARLLRLDPEHHVLLIGLHHAIADGWSLGILSKDLANFYRGWAESSELGPPKVATAPLQYADYALWQRQWLEGEILDRQAEFWRRELAGGPEALGLPTSRSRPPVQTFRGQRLGLVLPGDLIEKLQQRVRETRSTPFLILEAVFAEVLGRHANAPEVHVGTPVANRRYRELEGVVGLFVNTLVLPNRRRRESVRQRISRLRETALGAFAHQDLPFERLVEILNPPRDPSRSPLFQALFVLQNTPTGEFELPGLRCSTVAPRETAAKYDLTLELAEVEENGCPLLVGALEYNRDLFDRAPMERLRGHFKTLLEAFLEAPEAAVPELSMLSKAERGQVLREFNPPAPAGSAGSAAEESVAWVHRLVELQARHRPAALAVVAEEETLTYGELLARARHLARRIRRHEALPAAGLPVVGVMLERSPRWIVAILAILEAGAVYLPLDPDYPAERLRFMVEDSRCSLVVSSHRWQDRLPQPPSDQALPILIVEEEEEKTHPSPPGTDGPTTTVATAPAYLIYTSGSTGKPKGVLVPHRGFVNMIRAQRHLLPVETSSRVLQFASPNFDASMWEIFMALGRGGCLHLPPDGPFLPGAQLADLCRRRQITHLTLTPSALAVTPQEGMESVANLVVAGEACPGDLAAKWSVGRRFLNAYGPTEASVCATCSRPLTGAMPQAPSVGRPLSGTAAYVVDPAIEVCPLEVPGELALRGRGLAVGYLRRPALTAERFVPDPFGGEAGGRLYRTGDLARWSAEGELRFVGRIDHQVKVRGMRVELGEIEARLRRHPAVAEACVLVDADSSAAGGSRLVAAIGRLRATAAPLEKNLPQALEAFLGQTLPGYMVPAAFAVLDRLPATPNGKVDREACRAAARDAAKQGQSWKASGDRFARTTEEELLATIWGEVLSRDPATLHRECDFFQVGGHSLAAIRVASQVRQAFGVELPIPDIFAHPTLGALAAHLPTLRRRGPALLPPAPREHEAAPPLSFGQERLWFLHRLEGTSPAYNMPMAMRLEGDLQPACLAAALGAILRRHESLRTHFAEGEGGAYQVIEPHEGFELPLVDLSGFEPSTARARARELVVQDSLLPFDLEADLLFRARLLRQGDEGHLLLINCHHSVSDGWSMGIFSREVVALYNSHAIGAATPAGLPDLPLRYVDYAAWQRESLAGEALEAQLEFWTKALAGAPQTLDLPTRGPRPPVKSHRGAQLGFSIDGGLKTRLEELARSHRATLFLVLEAAFAELLGRYGGAREVNLGTPVANRRHRELEPLIGLFVNTLVLRNRLDESHSVAQRIGAVRDMALGAFAHQDLPFERLVSALNPPRDPGRTPLFQVMINLQEKGGAAAPMHGLTVSPVASPQVVARFDLSLSLAVGEENIQAAFIYDTDLFKADLLARMKDHFLTLLAAFADHPQARVSELSMLLKTEVEEVHFEGPSLRTTLPGGTFLTAFDRQVRRAPEATALVFGEARMSYRELDHRANFLVHRLRAAGIGRGSRLGICLERSEKELLAVLAVLKSGAAFVPLDPDLPARRLRLMIEDSQPQLVLGEPRAFEVLPGEIPTLDLGDADGRLEESPPSGPRPEDTAYIIYTSGSTGRPKGIPISHGSLGDYLGWVTATFKEPMPTTSKLSFDACLKQLLAPLTAGKTVLLLSPPDLRDPMCLLARLRSLEVRALNCIPSLWQALLGVVEEGRGTLSPSLETLVLSGDVIPPALLARTRRLRPDLTIWNVYGPTEATANATAAKLEAGEGAHLGRPIAGTSARVVDRLLRPVPAGIPGELLLGGSSLTCGYLHRPALTAAAFVPDATGAAGERLYRTGDRVVIDDGKLCFLGRIDSQVKLRGFRIELGEIETALKACPGVAQAVVRLRRKAPEQESLVAYVGTSRAPGNRGVLSAKSLRRQLAETLPEYMIPGVFVVLPELPMTTTGKLDLQALAELPLVGGDAGGVTEEGTEEGTEGSETRWTTEQELLRGIFAEILGRPTSSIGLDASFFDLGGHSLAATRVTALVRRAFGVELPLMEVFSRPSVGALSALLTTTLVGSSSEEAFSAPQRSEDSGPAPLSYAQQRLWFLDRLEGGASANYNMPIALALEGDLHIPALEKALDHILRRHEVLRTRFELAPKLGPRDGENDGEIPVQIIAAPTPFVLDLTDLCRLPSRYREALALRIADAEAVRPFDLATGPLFRAHLLRLGRREHRLLISLHHIVGDGWSLGVLGKELSALYTAALAPEPKPLAEALEELPLQYADFARWQRSWLESGISRDQVDYWVTQMAGAPEALDLPTLGPRPSRQTYRGQRYLLRLPEELSSRLQELARSTHTTLFLVLEGAFAELLGRTSGATQVNIGTPVAGRRFAELEPLVGLFLNTLVLRNRRSRGETIAERLAAVREMALGAFAHQDLPFEHLVEALNPVRDPSRSPLFQALFVLQNAPVVPLDMPGLTAHRLPVAETVAKFDLTLALGESPTGLSGSLEYDRALFDPGMIQRLAGHFENLLEHLTAAFDEPGLARRIEDLSLLSAAERFQLLQGFNDAPLLEPLADQPISLHGFFARQARRTPDAVALIFDHERITYRELAGRVDHLAHHLLGRGAGPEQTVAILLERRPELIVGLLAILATGSAYLPLDPAYPKERIAFMLEDAEASLLLTSADALATREVRPRCPVLLWEDLPEPQGEGPGSMRYRLNPVTDSVTDPQQLAYLIYTSGSTGTPKAVAIHHGSATALIRWAGTVFSPQDLAGVLASTSVCFDLSVFEIFAPLSSGGALVLAQDVLSLENLPQRDAVTLVNTVPSAIRELLELGGLPACVQVVNLAGEPLSQELSDELYASGSVDRVYDLYGPSEDTTYSTFSLRSPDGPATIGRPIPGTRAYLLDRSHRPVPLGVPGEILLGGDGLARGYLDRPAPTALRFVPDSFSGRSGARLYRTGDLAQYLSPGSLKLLGRIDHQVKIRGFRIEVGEIEAALAHHPAVEQAAVLVEDNPAGKRLVAFLSARNDGDPRSESFPEAKIREDLGKRLPDYMLPSAFIVLERLPTMPNGKLDRRALEAFAVERRLCEATPARAAEKPEEILLCQIWAQVLGLEASQLGADSDFFRAGGHSLAATRVTARIRKATGVDLPLLEIFSSPTVELLAQRILDLGGRLNGPSNALPAMAEPAPSAPAKTTSPLIKLRAGRGKPIFFVPEIQGSATAYRNLVQRMETRRPIYAFQAPGLDGTTPPLESLDAMAEIYLENVLNAQPRGPYTLIGWSMGGNIALEMARSLRKKRRKVARLVMIDTHAPDLIRRHADGEDFVHRRLARELGLSASDWSFEELSQGYPDPLAELWNRARQKGLLAGEDDEESRHRRLTPFRVLQAHHKAINVHVQETYAGAVDLFRARRNAGSQKRRKPAKLGWEAVVTGPLRVRKLDGDHHSLVLGEEAQTLAKILDRLCGN